MERSRRWKLLATSIGCPILMLGIIIGAGVLFLRLNPLHLGHPAPAGVILHNAIGVRVKVLQNVLDPPGETHHFNRVIAEMAPGDYIRVIWIFQEYPSYRAEDPAGQTIYCGPYERDTYRDASLSDTYNVEIARMVDITVERLNGETVCQPPSSKG